MELRYKTFRKPVDLTEFVEKYSISKEDIQSIQMDGSMFVMFYWR